MSIFSSIDIQEVRPGLFRMRWDIDDVTSGAQQETITLCGTQSDRSYLISFEPKQLSYRSARRIKNNWPFYIRLSVKEITVDDDLSSTTELSTASSNSQSEEIEEPTRGSSINSAAAAESDLEPLSPEYVWVSREIGDDIHLLHENETGTWRLATFSVWQQPLTITFWMDFGTKTHGEKKIMNGLADLFVNQSHCDVEFQLKDEQNTVGAHVSILSAGSPVFAAMFQTGFLESHTRKVVINDIKKDVFCQLLTYLYTGKAPELENEEITQPLFEAADKYGVTTLKCECVDVMLNRLTLDNVTNLLVWSHLHSIPLLYEAALKFISVNGRHLCFRPDWTKLMTNYPELCLLATQRIVNQLSSNTTEETEMYSESE